MVINSNKALEVGKLYSIKTIYRHPEEEVDIAYPIDMFIFATRKLSGDFDESGLSIENGTLVVYLDYIEHAEHSPFAYGHEEVLCYFKLLFPSGIGYILDDGCCVFEKRC
jgi:hypothetical protein